MTAAATASSGDPKPLPAIIFGSSYMFGNLYEFDVGETEVFSLGQQFLRRELRQRVGEAVSEVEAGGVAAFAIFAPGRARDLDLLGIHRNHLELCAHQEQVELAAGRFAAFSLKHDAGLQRIRRGE